MISQDFFVNVSVCKCNIKSKPHTFYGRVCKTGRVETNTLLSRLKEVAPYIDINMMEAGMKKIAELIAELVASGMDVDFFNLGTFRLSCEGAIEVNPAMQSYVEDGVSEYENADFDVSQAVTKQPNFRLMFEPSTSCKKSYEQVKMSLALKKRRAPVIEKIEDAVPEGASNGASILRVMGENLKIAGDNENVGVYIKEENVDEVKIEKANIIQNTPKMLLILLDKQLKNDASYKLSLLTQYVPMGSTSTTSILRRGEADFTWKKSNSQKTYEHQDKDRKTYPTDSKQTYSTDSKKVLIEKKKDDQNEKKTKKVIKVSAVRRKKKVQVIKKLEKLALAA